MHESSLHNVTMVTDNMKHSEPKWAMAGVSIQSKQLVNPPSFILLQFYDSTGYMKSVQPRQLKNMSEMTSYRYMAS
jgi:hypothetical protein